MASIVEDSIEYEGNMIELGWEELDFVNEISSFSKISLLHRYIWAMIAVQHRRDYSENRDFYDKEEINKIEGLLKAYEIEYLPYNNFVSSLPSPSKDVGEDFYSWFISEQNSFEDLWEKLTEEVFYLLFGNRTFLLRFNKNIANYLRNEKKHLVPSDCLDENGTIKRQYLPTWLERAVYFREQGRCALCQVDLSGLCSREREREKHFDHIVPLAEWGVNDPCNIQLLCQKCNLKKGKRKSVTGNRYRPWWED